MAHYDYSGNKIDDNNISSVPIKRLIQSQENGKRLRIDLSLFISEVTEQDPSWVMERRIEFLNNKIFELQKNINWWTAQESHYGELGEVSDSARIIFEQIESVIIIPFKKQKDKLQNEIDLYLNPVVVDYTQKITDKDVEEARSVPMDLLLDFNRSGFALCLWHSDAHPSMKWWKKHNVVKCFSCNKSADTIGAIRKLNGCSFKEAVENLKRF